MALVFSAFLWPPEPLLQYPCVRAQAVLANVPSFRFLGSRNTKIIAFFCQGSTAGKNFLEDISVQGNICQNHPYGSHPSMNPRARVLGVRVVKTVLLETVVLPPAGRK